MIVNGDTTMETRMNRYTYAQAMYAVGKSPTNVTRLQTFVLSFSFDDIPARHSIIPIGIYSAQDLSDRCTEKKCISQTLIQGSQGKCS